jgi:hypothetical protein
MTWGGRGNAVRERLSKGARLLVVAFALLPVSQAGAAPVWSIADFSRNSVTTLLDVSCVSATACTAVGRNGNNSATWKTSVKSWNGKSWSMQPSPGATPSVLSGVSCLAASWCQAVGANGTQPLTEKWDGHTWSTVANPVKGATLAELNEVSCVSRTSCVAVGSSFVNGVRATGTLIESWNGHAWSVVPSPSPGNEFNSLLGVSCVSRVSCQAVGISINGSIGERALVESWNGKVWSVVPSAVPKAAYESVLLRKVSCVSAGSCVAVGEYVTVEFAIRTLIESWNGHTWSIVPSPNRGSYSQLNDVSCVSATSCQAVGFTNNGIAFRTLVESRNGKAWSIASSPNPAPESGLLEGVSCVQVTSCTAVGDEALIESYD